MTSAFAWRDSCRLFAVSALYSTNLPVAPGSLDFSLCISVPSDEEDVTFCVLVLGGPIRLLGTGQSSASSALVLGAQPCTSIALEWLALETEIFLSFSSPARDRGYGLLRFLQGLPLSSCRGCRDLYVPIPSF